MITQRKFNIPIFDYKLTVVIYDSWDEVKHCFDDGPKPKAITRGGYGSAMVGIDAISSSIASIAHESEHVKNLIWEYIGYTPQRDNDEVDAYLITYIFDKMMSVYQKHDRVIK